MFCRIFKKYCFSLESWILLLSFAESKHIIKSEKRKRNLSAEKLFVSLSLYDSLREQPGTSLRLAKVETVKVDENSIHKKIPPHKKIVILKYLKVLFFCNFFLCKFFAILSQFCCEFMNEITEFCEFSFVFLNIFPYK